MAKTFQSVFMGAAGGGVALPSDPNFNTVSFLSHFDGSNNGVNNAFDDSSSSNHTITSNGDATQGSFGPFARSDGYWGVAFDGSDDRLSAPDSADFDFGTGDFTIELFFNYKGSIANRWLIGGANHWQLRIKTASSPSRLGEVSFITNGSTEIIYVSPSDLADSAWHHIAITREGTNLRHFLDGALVKTTTNSETINADSALYIGASSTNSEDWDGHISNVRVVKGTAVYTSAFTTPAAPLTAVTNTKLLTCQSNRFVDNSASAHTITPSGDAAVSAFGPFLTSEVYDAAVNGASAYFDGNDDRLSAPDSADFNVGSGLFTAETWIFPTASPNQPIIMGQWSGSYSWAMMLSNDGNRYPRFLIYDGSFSDNVSSTSVPLNAWSHLALVRESGNVFKIYLNGIQIYSATINKTANNSSDPLTVGADNSGGSPFQGYLADTRFTKGTAIYTSAFTPPTAPLTAVTNTKLLLNMADGQAIDSAAKNNLTLYGNAKVSNAQSKFGGTSIYFDGTGDYATLSNSSDNNFGSGDWTIEGWLYLTANAGTGNDEFAVASKWGDGSTRSWLARIANGNKLTFWYINNSGTQVELTPDTRVLSLNTWYHVAWVKNSNLKVYIDGVGSTLTASDFQIRNGTDLIQLSGRASGDNMYQGYIDDFRISSTARYTANFTAPTAAFADKGQ